MSAPLFFSKGIVTGIRIGIFAITKNTNNMVCKSILTGNLITMLRLVKNTTFSTAVHCTSDIIKNVRTNFETSDTQLLDARCDVNTEKKMMSNSST